MLKLNMIKRFVAVGAVAAATLVAGTAEAGWRHHGGSSSGGSWGSSGGSSSGGSWGSSGGSWGSSGGSSGGHWARKHSRVVYSYGSSGGSSSGGSWGSSGGSWGSSGGYAYYGGSSSGGSSSGGSWNYRAGSVYTDPSADEGVIIDDKAVTPDADKKDDKLPPQPKSTMMNGKTGVLTVQLPADAKVFVNGMPTTSTGASRLFVSRGLEQGRTYHYQVRAEVVRDGKTMTETKDVSLTAGEKNDLAFDFAAPQAEVATTVTVKVPAGAEVTLAGAKTTQTGEVRDFTTTKLAAGDQWKNYTITVTAKVDGKDVTKSKTITVTGGANQELSFDFDSTARTAAVSK